MPNDPLSHVASWLTPTSADVTDKPSPTSPPEDPVIALIAEEQRLDALWVAATTRGDEILQTLPEDIRERRVRVSFSDTELGRSLSKLGGYFTSEEKLQRFLAPWRRLQRIRAELDGESPEAAVEDFDREIGFDQALAQLRAGQAEIKAIHEASGCEAHYREARDLEAQVEAIFDQLRQTKPVTLGGAIAMLQHGYARELITLVLDGLRDLRAKARDGAPR